MPKEFINFMKFILGEKIENSQIFDEKGDVIPVTWISAGPSFVTQIKTEKNDGYESIQIGFRKKKDKKVKKTEKGKEYKYLKEIKVAREENIKIGDKITVSNFEEGDKVKISGTSKSKGFQGVVKRWGFAGANKTHGTKHTVRMPGSIGDMGIQRVLKGKKMGGRMGGKRITTKSSKIVKIDKEKNMIAITGAVPGSRGTIIEISAI